MAALWDPRRLLDVDPDGDFRCVGTTQKGTRCRNFYFSNSDKTEASILLDRMATSDPWEARRKLAYLAEITLCPRWHRKPSHSQVESMKRKWWSIIISTYPEPQPTRPIIRTTYNPALLPRNTRQNLGSTVSTLATRSLPTPPPSPLPAIRRRPLTSSALIVRTTTQVAGSIPTTPRRTPTDSPTQSSESSSVSAVLTRSRTATSDALITPPQSPIQLSTRGRYSNSSTFLPATVPTTSAASTASTASTDSRPQTPVSTSTPPLAPPEPVNGRIPHTPERPIQARAPPCPHSIRRKPLVDECPICNEDMHCLDDAVWCRAECGTNMHRGCFAPWRRACLDREATVTCVFCRAPWKFEWED